MHSRYRCFEQQGQALVEFVLILPILLLVILEGINVLLLIGAHDGVQDVESSVARWASASQWAEAAQVAANTFAAVPGMQGRPVAVLVTSPSEVANGQNVIYWATNGHTASPVTTSATDCSQVTSTTPSSGWGCIHIAWHPSSTPPSLVATAQSHQGTTVPAFEINQDPVTRGVTIPLSNICLFGFCLPNLTLGNALRAGSAVSVGSGTIQTVTLNNITMQGTPSMAVISSHFYGYRLVAPTFGILPQSLTLSVPPQQVPVGTP